MSDFVIFDTEFEWNRSNNPYPPRPDTVFEVIQIGALRIRRADLAIMDKLNVLIHPRLNPSLSPYFCTLTGITAEAISCGGLAFEEAASRFMNFCGTAPTFAYGDDAGLFIRNAQLVGTRLPPAWPNTRVSNIGPWFSSLNSKLATVNSGALARTLGLSLDNVAGEMGEHNALYDCYSIHAAMKHLVATHRAIIPE